MKTADLLIDEIVASSRIISAKRRREIARELRSHIEELAHLAREDGHGEPEIETMVVQNFGDPRQFGRNFAWVYRRERAMGLLIVFMASTAVVSFLIAAGIVAAQAGLAASLGISFGEHFGGRHLRIASIDVVATVAAFLGILSLEKVLPLAKATALFLTILGVLAGLASLSGLSARFLLFGFLTALFLRGAQLALTRPTVRLATVLGCFGLLAVFFWARSPVPYPLAISLASWLATGGAYYFMTGLAVRADCAFSHRLEQL
jgi:hypothetical protein